MAPRRKMISRQLAKFTQEGQSITGKLEEKGVQTINGRELGRYIMSNEVCTMIVNGTVQIDEAMASAAVGDILELVFIAEVPTSNGFKVKQFEVYILSDGEEDGEE